MHKLLPMKKPNIILINCDDLGYGDLGCYGSQVNQTPCLDTMAKEGIRFSDFYMASSVCSPSRGAMMTGCYPRRIGFGSFDDRWVLFPGQGLGLSPNERTIASVLREAGYATMCIGKWHCGDQPEFLPTRHGFDGYYGLPYSNDMGRQVGREGYPPLPLLKNEEVIQEQPNQTSLTERYLERAISFIRRNQDSPFFLYFAHMYVHLPLYVPDRFLKESRNGAYGAAVACIDWVAESLFAELQRLGMDDDTLVVFTSDNGCRGDNGGSNSPLRGGKGTTWEGGFRVPCIMRWPSAISGGQIYSRIFTSMDLYPTLCAVAGAAVPDDRKIDGAALDWVALDGIPSTQHVLSQRDTFFYYYKDQLEAVRSGRWKLFVRRKDEVVSELYDLNEDVGEKVNLHERHPEIVEELMEKLRACRDDLGDNALGMEGTGCRPCGTVANPKPLTEYVPGHPYYIAMYDIEDAG